MKFNYQIPQYYKVTVRHNSNGRSTVYVVLAFSLGQATAWSEHTASGLGSHVEAVSVIGQAIERELMKSSQGQRPIMVNACDYAPENVVAEFNTNNPGGCGDRAHYTPWDPILVAANRQALALELWEKVRDSVEGFDDMPVKVVSGLLYLLGAAINGSYCDFSLDTEHCDDNGYFKQIRQYLADNPEILELCNKNELII